MPSCQARTQFGMVVPSPPSSNDEFRRMLAGSLHIQVVVVVRGPVDEVVEATPLAMADAAAKDRRFGAAQLPSTIPDPTMMKRRRSVVRSRAPNKADESWLAPSSDSAMCLGI